MDKEQIIFFRDNLLEWAAQNPRPLPWKSLTDPYKIWLSEIILQQTRVEQGMPYYQRFLQHFPTLRDLAAASEDEVFALWQGLGYYSRARNLLHTAKILVQDHNSSFPSTYAELIKLKGIGPYTAAAIASFAFHLTHAVVDGNVLRVISRYLADETPIDASGAKRHYQLIADELVHPDYPARYNQAIMDFGAILCKPISPDCPICPFKKKCQGFIQQKIASLPQKQKKIIKKNRYFNYLVISNHHEVLIQKREKKDIWQGLYEFILVETDEIAEDIAKCIPYPAWPLDGQGSEWQLKKVSPIDHQILTHQKIFVKFFEIKLSPESSFPARPQTIVVQRKNLSKFAFPNIINRYLNK